MRERTELSADRPRSRVIRTKNAVGEQLLEGIDPDGVVWFLSAAAHELLLSRDLGNHERWLKLRVYNEPARADARPVIFYLTSEDEQVLLAYLLDRRDGVA